MTAKQTQITLPNKPLQRIKRGGSEFLHGQFNADNRQFDVYVWQSGYDNNLVQIIQSGNLIEQQTGSMNEVVAWLTPLGVYDETYN